MLSSKSAHRIFQNSLVCPKRYKGLRPWLLAFRPKTLTAALVPVVVATALVSALGFEIHWIISLLALLGAAFIQIGTNLINDAIDFKKGADREDRLGPVRVTQSGLLSSRSVLIGGLICFVLATVCGIPLVIAGGWPLAIIGLLALLFGYTYTGGPFPLAYLGLGDLFVILFFGLVAVEGVFFLQTKSWSLGAAVAGLQVGFLATALIAINNLRDIDQDRRADKKTLAVRFGPAFARIEIAFTLIAPFVLGVYWWNQDLRQAAILPFLILPWVLFLIRDVFGQKPGIEFNQFLARAAGLQILFGSLMTLGFLLS